MKYLEMKVGFEKELNDFKGVFYAFNDNQFNEGMEKLGLKSDDRKKIFSLGSGGYILKQKADSYHNMFNRFSEQLEKGLKEKSFLLEALIYELQNHEYCITCDIQDAIDSLGLTIEDIKKLDFGVDVLKKACFEAMRGY